MGGNSSQDLGFEQTRTPGETRAIKLERAVSVATVLGFVVQVFGASIRGTALVFVVSLVVYLTVAKLFPNRLNRATLTGPVLIACILFALLAGALLRQHYIDSNVIDIGEIADTYHWRLRLCLQSSCVADALVRLASGIPSKSSQPAEELFADQALGEIVRTSPESLKLLRDFYGVDSRFLGTGASLPSGTFEFTAQRIPEFLVPNYDDDHSGVLAWRLSVGDTLLDKPLEALLATQPFNKQISVERTRAEVKSNQADTHRPSLIRFAMVPDIKEPSGATHYSGCFGLPSRRRVFFSSLDYMIRHTSKVSDAADLSGYQFTDAQKQHLYVFVFVPANASETFAPTWRRLAADAGEQVQREALCAPR